MYPEHDYGNADDPPGGELPLGAILFGRPFADRKKVRYRWRPTVANLPAGDAITPAEKAVLLWEFEQQSAKARQPGHHHCGPLTRAYRDILRAIFRLHHSVTGVASFSYETLAAEAHTAVRTVTRALPAIEAFTGILILRRVLPVEREVRPGFSTTRTSNAFILRLKSMRAKVQDWREAYRQQQAEQREKRRKRPNGQNGREPFNLVDPTFSPTSSQQRAQARALDGAAERAEAALKAAAERVREAEAIREAGIATFGAQATADRPVSDPHSGRKEAAQPRPAELDTPPPPAGWDLAETMRRVREQVDAEFQPSLPDINEDRTDHRRVEISCALLLDKLATGMPLRQVWSLGMAQRQYRALLMLWRTVEGTY